MTAVAAQVCVDWLAFVTVTAPSDSSVVSPRTAQRDSGGSLLVGCLTSQQHASVFQGRICSHNFTCCYTAIEVADQTFHLIQSQYTDTRPTRPNADPIMPGAWQGSHWSAIFFFFLSHWYDSTPKKSRSKRDSNPGSCALEADALPLGQRGGKTCRVSRVHTLETHARLHIF